MGEVIPFPLPRRGPHILVTYDHGWCCFDVEWIELSSKNLLSTFFGWDAKAYIATMMFANSEADKLGLPVVVTESARRVGS